MGNMDLYNACRKVPEGAKKTITDGRLKGMTDIKPQWRIEKLTEMFGPCGFGWWYEITNKWLENKDDGTVKAFVDINLFDEMDGKVSRPIPGTGGNAFVSNERNGVYCSDECYKMALTDAISVAAKALGVGADVYYASNSDSKYRDSTEQDSGNHPKQDQPKQDSGKKTTPELKCAKCGAGISDKVAAYSFKQFGRYLCMKCQKGAH